MSSHLINLKDRSLAEATRVMTRLSKFKKDKNIKVTLRYILPERDKVKGHKGLKIDRRCPYCASKLVSTLNGVVCSGDLLNDVKREIKKAIKNHGENVDVMLSRKALYFYDLYVHEGKVYCDYIMGNSEKAFRKSWR